MLYLATIAVSLMTEKNKANDINSDGHVIFGDGSSITNIESLVIENGLRYSTLGLAIYFQSVFQRLNHLEYGDPSEYVSIKNSVNIANCPLDTVWIPPRFRKQEETGEDISFDTFIDDPAKTLLILGNPGCGKSTLSKFITCTMIERFCSGKSNFFGLFVPLSLIRGKADVEAVVYCATKYVGLETNKEVLEHLKEHISKAYIILDGFDEVPLATKSSDSGILSRAQIFELINTLQYLSSMNSGDGGPRKIFVTSRITDYFENRNLMLQNASNYFISRFSPAQMNLAVSKWHEAAKKCLIPTDKDAEYYDKRKIAIQSTLRDNQDLANICLTPLMLSALLTVYSDNNDIPASVSHLCWRSVKWFFVDKHKINGKGKFISENAENLLASIIEIGWMLQDRVVKGESKLFDSEELRKTVKTVYSADVKFKRLSFEEQENMIVKVVSFLRDGHGVLVSISSDEFDFAHNVFREVLAGKALGKLSVPERRDYALDRGWIAPIRYWAGLRAGENGGLYEINTLVGEIFDAVEDGNTQATIACGEMLSEVILVISEKPLPSDLKSRILKIKEKFSGYLKTKALGLEDRIRIGDILSVLGDPRLDIDINEKICWIPGGDYQIGRIDNHKTKIPKYGKCPASPPISGQLKAYGIGSYLVTNHEYNLFIRDGGYKNQKYWISKTAWGWASRDKKIIEQLISEANGLAYIHLSSELVNQRIVLDEIPDRCIAMIDRPLPLYWADPAFNRSNQPIVGVNWWECIAYCLWLSDKLREQGVIRENQSVRLPTEAEWETTARLSGNGEYPWLEGKPSYCSLIKSSFLSHGTPPLFRSSGIGLFQFVETVYPVFDMVGNVWEWTSSKAVPYNEETFNQVIDYESLDERIARGSSWLSSEEEAAQITFRSFDPPYNAYEDLGFRILIS